MCAMSLAMERGALFLLDMISLLATTLLKLDSVRLAKKVYS